MKMKMKRIFALLLTAVMLLSSMAAFADETVEPTPTPETTAEATATPVPVEATEQPAPTDDAVDANASALNTSTQTSNVVTFAAVAAAATADVTIAAGGSGTYSLNYAEYYNYSSSNSGISASGSGNTVTISVDSSVPAGTYTVSYEPKYSYLGSEGTITVEVGDSSSGSGSGSGSSTITSKGSFNHIEIEITGSASFKIDGETYTETVSITTDDNFTVTAYTLDSEGNQVPYTNFSFTEVTEGNGSTADSTVELTGSYPAGTKSAPVYYVVTLIKTVTFTLNDGSTMDVPVTLSVTTNYWDENNNCPGLGMVSDWANGGFSSTAGIDVPISGEAVGQAITKGKLAISKVITNDSTDTNAFTFTVQVSSTGEYLTFADNAYTGKTTTLTDACYVTVNAGSSLVLTDIPEGIYKITEIQKDGYIITDASGNESTNYTVDYKVETKNDDEIPIATFNNKKLSTEAGISIAKVAEGMSSYPNPTVSIYAADSDGNKTGEAKWTGTLVANGERWYLPITLPAGTYVIEETGYEASGYSCTTSVAGGETVNGMTFTVVEGKRYDLTVKNIYAARTNVTVTKTVSGNLGDRNKEFNFDVKVYDSTGAAYSDFTVTNKDGLHLEKLDGYYTFSHGDTVLINNVPYGGKIVITELPDGYTASAASAATISTASDASAGTFTVTYDDVIGGTTIAFTNTKSASPDTGIILDSLPYVLILALVAGVVVLGVARKRKYRDD